MKIDHLFLFEEPQGQNLRPCTRLARKPATAPTIPGTVPAIPGVPAPVEPQTPPAAQPTLPITPGSGNGSGILYGTAQ